MPKICYVPKNFRPASQELILKAIEVCEEYEAQGFDLTLRQLFYQFVSRAWIPNTQKSYKNLGGLINDARLAGLIDWDHLVDRTRNLKKQSHWTDPAHIVDSCAQSFAVDKWQGQENRVEVWVEKEALIGVIEGVCRRHDVPYFACKGYNSQSEMWAAGQRLSAVIQRKQHPVIIHLGDHDPSGIDMTRDNTDRLEMFASSLHQSVEVNRIALNMDQIEQYNPPPNPTKLTDARAASYVDLYGEESWELDALSPAVLDALIEKTILSYRDESQWDAMVEQEEEGRRLLTSVSEDWESLTENL